MKQPMSVAIILKDPKTEKEIHYQYDFVTAFPRIGLIKILLKSMFDLKS
jgi:hypothetical protein